MQRPSAECREATLGEIANLPNEGFEHDWIKERCRRCGACKVVLLWLGVTASPPQPVVATEPQLRLARGA